MKLAGAYERLGALYTATGRFTRAHQHYKQVFPGPAQPGLLLGFKRLCSFSERAHIIYIYI